jgi:hypothetical protein
LREKKRKVRFGKNAVPLVTRLKRMVGLEADTTEVTPAVTGDARLDSGDSDDDGEHPAVEKEMAKKTARDRRIENLLSRRATNAERVFAARRLACDWFARISEPITNPVRVWALDKHTQITTARTYVTHTPGGMTGLWIRLFLCTEFPALLGFFLRSDTLPFTRNNFFLKCITPGWLLGPNASTGGVYAQLFFALIAACLAVVGPGLSAVFDSVTKRHWQTVWRRAHLVEAGGVGLRDSDFSGSSAKQRRTKIATHDATRAERQRRCGSVLSRRDWLVLSDDKIAAKLEDHLGTPHSIRSTELHPKEDEKMQAARARYGRTGRSQIQAPAV